MCDIKTTLVRYMEANRVPYSDIAEKAGMSRQLLYKILNCDTKLRLDSALKISESLDLKITVDDLEGDEVVASSTGYLKEIASKNMHITTEDLQEIYRPMGYELNLRITATNTHIGSR